MPKNDMTFKIGGEAGQGIESSGAGFAKVLARGGWHVFGLQDYMSRIRGGHNFYQICWRLEIGGWRLEIQLPTSNFQLPAYEGFKLDKEDLEKRGIRLFPVPLFKIAEEGGSKVMANTAALSAAIGVAEYGFESMAGVIGDDFARKGQSVVDTNLATARKAYDFARQRYAAGFDYKLEPVEAPPRMVMNGNQALCLGAVLGGCRFISAYPMTPDPDLAHPGVDGGPRFSLWPGRQGQRGRDRRFGYGHRSKPRWRAGHDRDFRRRLLADGRGSGAGGGPMMGGPPHDGGAPP